MPSIFACPHCGATLTELEKVYTCPKGHSFDKSSFGYVNLLLAKDSRGHGDGKEMISSRNRFLSGGWYQPLLDQIIQTLIPLFPQNGVLLDAGCGEGWYTEGICQALAQEGKNHSAFGIDISKDALKAAGKRPLGKKGKIKYAVGSVYKMPVAEKSVDVVLNLFAPLVPEVYQRLLREGGYFLMAVPDTHHLWGLKEVLYDTPYQNQVADSHIEGFTLLREETVSSKVTLTSKEDIWSLFYMTPYAFRTGEAGKERLQALDSLTTEIAFRVFLYRLN